MPPSIIEIIQTLISKLLRAWIRTYVQLFFVFAILFISISKRFILCLGNKWSHWNIVFLGSPQWISFFLMGLYFLQSIVWCELWLFRHNREDATHLLSVLAVLRDLVREWNFVLNFNHVYAFLPYYWQFKIYGWSSLYLFYFLLINIRNFDSEFEVFKSWIRVYYLFVSLRILWNAYINWVWLLFN